MTEVMTHCNRISAVTRVAGWTLLRHTAGRELHPAPKVIYSIDLLQYNRVNVRKTED